MGKKENGEKNRKRGTAVDGSERYKSLTISKEPKSETNDLGINYISGGGACGIGNGEGE